MAGTDEVPKHFNVMVCLLITCIYLTETHLQLKVCSPIFILLNYIANKKITKLSIPVNITVYLMIP